MKLILTLLLGCSTFAWAEAIYICQQNGVTLYSQLPCSESPAQAQIYQPNLPVIQLHGAPQRLSSFTQLDSPTDPKEMLASLKHARLEQNHCEVLGLKGHFRGTVRNSSRTLWLKVWLHVRFDFEKAGRMQKGWDQKRRYFKLAPGATSTFELESRTLPPQSRLSCNTYWRNG